MREPAADLGGRFGGTRPPAVAAHALVLGEADEDRPAGDEEGRISAPQQRDVSQARGVVTAEDILHHRIYEVNEGEWNNPKLRTLLEEILPRNSSCEDFALESDFPKIGRKRVVLNANRLVCDEGRTQLILLSIETVTDLPGKK